MVSQGKGHVQQASQCCAPKGIIPLLEQTVPQVGNNQQGFSGKYLLRFRLTDVVALLAFPGVAFVPLKPDYVAKVNCWSHLSLRLQLKPWHFNPCDGDALDG